MLSGRRRATLVTDLNQPMLDYAAARQAADDRISWRKADALALPFEDGSASMLVCCQFGVDVLSGQGSRLRARPGESSSRADASCFNVWDRIEENEFADDVTERARAGIFPDDPPRFLARTPHGYHDHGC